MSWEKLVEREGDFLKNYLLYENFEANFPKIFQTNHANFLTVRTGNTFIHYIDKDHKVILSRFIKDQLGKDPDFMRTNVELGKKHFSNLIAFCEELGDLQNKNNEELGKLAEEYFRLYKEPYPYFNLTIFSWTSSRRSPSTRIVSTAFCSFPTSSSVKSLTLFCFSFN